MGRSWKSVLCMAGFGTGVMVIPIADPAEPLLEIPAATMGDSCVEPVDIMRRDHMDFLFHQRDRTVYQGEREAKHSLTGCLDCHTRKDSQGDYIPINAPGEFCQACHAFSSVKMDCFECHASRPLSVQQASSDQ